MSWMILFKKIIIWPWSQRSRFHEDHYVTGHTALWSCTHIQISLTYLERQKCYGLDKKILFLNKLFDLQVKGQGPTKVIMVRDTPPYGDAPTYEISLTYLEKQKSCGPDKFRWEEAEEKIRLKQYASLRSKGRHNNIINCYSGQ